MFAIIYCSFIQVPQCVSIGWGGKEMYKVILLKTRKGLEKKMYTFEINLSILENSSNTSLARLCAYCFLNFFFLKIV